MIWLAFAACVAVVVVTGSRLTRYGDVIAEKTGMGRAWVGLVLLASVTSLPELATGISSVALFDVPNIALGDIFGSCMFNLVIIALVDAFQHEPLSARVHEGLAVSASFGIFLLALAAIGIVANDVLPAFGWIGVSSLVLIALYAASMRVVFQYEKKRIAQFVQEVAEAKLKEDISLRTALIRYSINAALTATAAIFLPKIGETIATQTGLTQTFVGNAFIAISTSLPELTVAIVAVKLDAADLAVGNIFGSNLFNVAIIAVDDVAYTKGPLLARASPAQLISALAAIAMTAIVTVGLTYRIRKKRFPLALDSIGVVATYILAMLILASHEAQAFLR